MQSQGMGLILNFQDRQTHERNNEVKRKLQTVYSRIRAMLKGAGLKDEVRNEVCAEYAMTATYFLNIIWTTSGVKCPYEMLFGNKTW
jgi:hypothetical protein